MSSLHKAVAFLFLASLIGCGADTLSSPLRVVPDKPDGNVYPAWQYKPVVLLPGPQSLASDVNDLNEIVGYTNGEAFWMPFGGSHLLLAHPGSTGANAGAINGKSAIAGAVITNGLYVPAYWRNPGAAPLQLKGNGSSLDLNDRSEVVGWINVKGIVRAFYWETATNTRVHLPRYSTGNDDYAWAINNDRIVVGTSAGYPVMWRQINGVWTVSLLQGMFPYDIDAGNGTVGSDGSGHATFGRPSLAGYFGTTWTGTAWAVNGLGDAVGEDWNTSTGQMLPWVGDRAGGFTYLPFPSGSTYNQASARGINNCGLVVGFLGNVFSGEAIAWNPGC